VVEAAHLELLVGAISSAHAGAGQELDSVLQVDDAAVCEHGGGDHGARYGQVSIGHAELRDRHWPLTRGGDGNFVKTEGSVLEVGVLAFGVAVLRVKHRAQGKAEEKGK
jgi:hypothetical protein